MTALAALALARQPGELALCIVACVALAAAVGHLAWKTIDGSRKDG
jgi:hypothetical protein